MQKTSIDIVIFLAVTASLILFMGSFIVTILFLYRKRQIKYFKDLERIRSDYEKNVLKNQLEIQEQTFQTISREIHDNITLSLTLAKLHLNTFDFSSDGNSKDKLQNSVELIGRAINDLSNISRSLNSDIIQQEGLIIAINLEIDKIKKLKQYKMKLEVNGTPVFMDVQKEVFIFRIIQESFNNILKHAHATVIHLDLNYYDNLIDITITDNGVGIQDKKFEDSSIKGSSSGIRNMRTRTELLNGIFKIASFPGMGTTINLRIPY